MRRYRRGKKDDDDEVLTFDDMEDEEEEEERPRRRRRYAPPRPMKVTRFSDYEPEDEEEVPDHDELEAKVRAGGYKPKRSDPWTIHVLYNLLVERGEIQG